jgi:thiol-disulfide isomerase/thioredoxin
MQSFSTAGLFKDQASFRNIWAQLASILLLSAYVLSDVAVEAGNFTNCTPEQLSTALKSQDWSTVLFYSSLCPHCKNMMPNLDQASYQLTGSEGRRILRLNCQEFPQLIMEYNITYFPWLAYYQKSEFKDLFKLGTTKTPSDIVDWITSHHGKNAIPSPIHADDREPKSITGLGISDKWSAPELPKLIYTAKIEAKSLESPSVRQELIKHELSLPGFKNSLFSISKPVNSKPNENKLPRQPTKSSPAKGLNANNSAGVKKP